MDGWMERKRNVESREVAEKRWMDGWMEEEKKKGSVSRKEAESQRFK